MDDDTVVSLDDRRPHFVLPSLTDDRVHVVPVEMIRRIVSGELPLREVEYLEDIVRAIFDEWLEGQES